MATFLISGFSFQKSNVEKHKNGHNSVILAQNEKDKTTFFSPTFKVVLFFHLGLKWVSYGHFFVSQHMSSETKIQKSRKWPYLTHFSPKWKNKTTLFPSTLKVGEKKVVLFFHFKLKWPRYCQLFFFKEKYLTTWKENGWGSWTGRRSEARGLKFFVWV